MTDAHDQKGTIHLIWHYPEHETRKGDKNYSSFKKAEARAKAAGLWKCVVCGSTENVQGHHSEVEFALQNGVDLQKWDELHGLHLTEDEFKQWIEGPNNLEPLCRSHHTGAEGVHMLPEPAWKMLRVWRNDLKPPAEVVHNVSDSSDEPDQGEPA